jgi:hypothetical protein
MNVDDDHPKTRPARPAAPTARCGVFRERPSMSRAHYGSRAVARLSRRRVLTIAATVGVGAAATGVAGLSLAGESAKKGAADSAPLVISLRDAKKGTFDVFAGSSRIELTDPDLAKRLLELAHRR